MGARRLAGVWLAAASLALVVAGAGPSRAVEPVELTPAEALHAQAAAAYRSGELARAIALWRAALERERHWKYAYNLANTLFEAGQAEEAWGSARLAESLAPPAPYVAALVELRVKIGARLRTDHAFVRLDVTPSDARVERNGVPWEAPRELWTTDPASRLYIERDGYESQSLVLDHPAGARVAKAVALAALPMPGRLVVTGTPAGARVTVDGAPVGELPRVGPLEVTPGEHAVTVELAGWSPQRTRVMAVRDGDSTLEVALAALPPKKPPDKPDCGLATAGWVTLAAGAVVGAVGAGLLVADGGAEQHTAGAVLGGVGAAALATGLVLVVVAF